MDTTTTTCAACGNTASGKFCNSCGAPLTEQRCKGCGSTLSAGARFCHMCGVPLAAAPAPPAAPAASSGGNAGWIAAGVASVALVIAVGSRFMDRPTQAGIPQMNAPVATSAAPDISQMTPRERADRLFERIMIADSRGLSDTVAFFTPMALSAYAMLGETDIDALYHVGLIQALAGNADAVRAAADSIRMEVPTHLMATMLDFAYYRLEGDSSNLGNAYAEFIANHDAEVATARPEYQAHERAIETFLTDARAGGS